MDKTTVSIELTVPAMSLVGFEHEPTTEKQRQLYCSCFRVTNSSKFSDTVSKKADSLKKES